MKSFFLQYGRWLILAFVVGFLFPRVNPGFFKADATANPYNDKTLEDAFVDYHLAVNEITNTYLKLLTDPDFEKLGYVEYPPDDSDCGTAKNVSTYCLSVALVNELTLFEDSVKARVGEFDLENGDFSNVTSLQSALQQASSQRELIQEQVDTAEDALDLTLAVYNQVQTVYPLHTEFEKLIENLKDYRKNLASLRDAISPYPSKFNGATSSQCK